jgi:hypothetical protein
MSASSQIAQGAGSNVGSTVCAPTRVKDAGNSNLGTFGVRVLPFVHRLPFFLPYRAKRCVVTQSTMCPCSVLSVGQIWPCPDAKGAPCPAVRLPLHPFDLEVGWRHNGRRQCRTGAHAVHPHCTPLLWLLMAVRLPPQRIIFYTQGADS